jgi:YHS domain-containing protein
MISPPPNLLGASCRAAGLSGGVAMLVAAMAWPAAADIAWHADLDTARAASAASGRPVMALVVAAWDDRPAAEVFGNSEVDAVVSACFEPVRIDVDPAPELARQLGIERVPSIAVLDAAARVVTRFDCPPTPAEFVAAAARAAQLAAATAANRLDPTPAAAREQHSFGLAMLDACEQPAANMTAKVRQLSSFAAGGQTPARDPSRFPLPVSTAEHHSPPSALAAAQFTDDPALPAAWPADSAAPAAWPADSAAPAAWPAERPVASAFDPREPASTQAGQIEPAPTAASPWLAGVPQAQPGVASQTATASDLEAESATAGDGQSEKQSNWFMDTIQRPLNWLTGRSAKPAVEPPPKMPAARPQSQAAIVAGAVAAAPPAADPHGSMPLGLEGYCPVTIADRGMWVEGRAQWGVRHRGRTYLFAGPEQQQAFLTTPDRYAPALSGDDPVLAFDSGTAEPGRRAYGVTYQSRMYLFASPETRASFAADPARYTARVQLAEGLPAPESPRRF